MARLRQRSGNIRIGPERKRLSLAAVPVLVVPVPPTLGVKEQIQTAPKESLAGVTDLPDDARVFSLPTGALWSSGELANFRRWRCAGPHRNFGVLRPKRP